MDKTTVLTYGKYAMKKSSVFEWNEWFKEGWDVQDNPRSGQPKTQRTDAMCTQIKD
jgi:hypothetical protein